MRKHSRYMNICYFAILVKTFSKNSFASVDQRFGLSELDEHEDIIKDGSDRVLKTISSRIIDVIGRNDNAIRVRIKQEFLGSCDSESADNHVASMFFATYTDPDSGQEVCSFRGNATACFARVLNVGCDPKTNLAEVNIFAVSKSFYRWDLALNPKVGGQCFINNDLFIKKARSVQLLLPCDLENATPCKDNKDCSPGKYCPLPDDLLSYDYGVVRFCIPFVTKPGEACDLIEGDLIFYYPMLKPFLIDECTSGSYCRIDSSKCKAPNRNRLAIPATCVSYGKLCSYDSECDKLTEYCNYRRCTPYAEDGECCGGWVEIKVQNFIPSVACRGDSMCSELYSAEDIDRKSYLPRPPRICRPPCTKHADCVPKVEVCGEPHFENGLRYCRSNTIVTKNDLLVRDRFRKKFPPGD